MVAIANQNIYFKYVLTDILFSSAKNMSFIKKECGNDFILAIKDNRKVALSKQDKANGIYVNIKSLEMKGRILSIKSNSAFAKSPTRRVVTQESHFIASILAYIKLERMNVRLGKNHFALKSRLHVAASKATYEKWSKLSTPNFKWNKKIA